MKSNQDSLHTLHEIRELMERSSKFLSLSGLSGVFAGVFALIGAGVAYLRYKTDLFAKILSPVGMYDGSRSDLISFLVLDGVVVLLLSLAFCIVLTVKKGRKRGLTLWNGSSRRLLVSMLIPLVTGGIFCLAMLSYGFIWLVFPATLLFYGLALVNASRFTFPEVFYLGLSEIGIGCLALFFTGYSLLFWSLGFGVLHIIYGLSMYNRYERESALTKGSIPKAFLIAGGMLLFAGQSQGQILSDSTSSEAVKWYDRETIYLRGGNSFVKNNVVYNGRRALAKEFIVSTRGMDLYLRSRRLRSIGLVFSLAGSAGSIVSLVSGNRDNWRTFFWISIGTGVVSSAITLQANNLRDEAVWQRNRDAMILQSTQ